MSSRRTCAAVLDQAVLKLGSSGLFILKLQAWCSLITQCKGIPVQRHTSALHQGCGLLPTTHLWSASQRRLVFVASEEVCCGACKHTRRAALRLGQVTQAAASTFVSLRADTMTPVYSCVQVYWEGAEGAVDHEVLTHQQLKGLVTERFIRERWVDMKIQMLQEVRARSLALPITLPLPLSNGSGCCVR